MRGGRVNWLRGRRFLALLISFFLLFVVYPPLRGFVSGRLLFDATLSAVFLAAFVIVFTGGRARTLAVLLGVPTLVGLWIGYALPDLPPVPSSVAFHLAGASFMAYVVAAILRTTYRQPAVSLDAVYGALCGYVILGLAFGHVYCVTEAITPGSFSRGGVALSLQHDGERQHYLLSYFSFCTLTTVGYGDVTPTKEAAQGIAVVEAILGQFYIAVLMAELIGKRVAQSVGRTSTSDNSSASGGDPDAEE